MKSILSAFLGKGQLRPLHVSTVLCFVDSFTNGRFKVQKYFQKQDADAENSSFTPTSSLLVQSKAEQFDNSLRCSVAPVRSRLVLLNVYRNKRAFQETE